MRAVPEHLGGRLVQLARADLLTEEALVQPEAFRLVRPEHVVDRPLANLSVCRLAGRELLRELREARQQAWAESRALVVLLAGEADCRARRSLAAGLLRLGWGLRWHGLGFAAVEAG